MNESKASTIFIDFKFLINCPHIFVQYKCLGHHAPDTETSCEKNIVKDADDIVS